MKRFKLLSLLAVITVIAACSKSNEEEERADPTNNGGNCNTANMSFAADIVPMIQSNCYACHSNTNQSVSGISLEGYSNVKARVDDGRLIGAITHASGFSPMPQNGPKLSDCNISKIRSWITNGALNN